MRPDVPLVIAHRGASAYRAENTFPAYELALEQRADMIEVDLHRTRDGGIVVTHDAELARIGGRGEVADATLAELETLDAGGGAKVPRLDALLDAFGSRIAFNLEIKRSTRGVYDGLEAPVVDAVAERGLLDRTLFSSFYDPVLRELRRVSEGARIALLVSPRYPQRIFERAAAVRAEAVNPEDSLVTQELVAQAHDRGLAVYVYTVDDPARMEHLLAWGVDGIFSNVPDRLRAVVDARVPSSPR